MKKIIGIPVLLLLSLYACNSGSNNTSSSSDSAVTKMSDTSSAKMDTLKPAPSTSMDLLPEIPAGSKVMFKNLKDGQTVKSPLKVEMGITGMSVDSAGMVKPASGHFHLLIDAGDSTPTEVVVPKDSTHLHFGNAQHEATINLSPGKHRLAIQFADGIHRSYGARLAQAITVNVK